MADSKELAHMLIRNINGAELAVRMCEASYNIKRPPNMTAEQALAAMEDDSRDGWMRAASTAMKYWVDCINMEIAEQRKRMV